MGAMKVSAFSSALVSGSCFTVKVLSPSFILTSGVYPPSMQILDLVNQTIKISRSVDDTVLDTVGVSESKFVLLTSSFLEFHAKYGKHFVLGLDAKYRAMVLWRNELIVGGCGNMVVDIGVGRLTENYMTGRIEAIAANRTLLGTAGKYVRLFDCRTRKKIQEVEISEEVTAMSFSPNQINYVIGTAQGNVIEMDVRSEKIIKMLNIPERLENFEKSEELKNFENSKNLETFQYDESTKINQLVYNGTNWTCSMQNHVFLKDLTLTLPNRVNQYDILEGCVFSALENGHMETYYDEKIGGIPKWFPFVN